MNKNFFVLPLIAFMMVGMVGCANDNDDKLGENGNRDNNIQNVRYNPNDQGRNINGTNTNDRNNNQNRDNMNNTRIDARYDNNGRYIGNTRNRNTTNQNAINGDDRFWENAQVMNNKSEKIARKTSNIAAKQKNVRSAQSYVVGDTIFVTLQVENGVNDGKVINKVRSALRDEVKGKNFNIMTDIGSFDQMKNSKRGVTSDNAPVNRNF